MTRESTFSGSSGRTAWEFMTPSTVITLVPATLAMLVLAGVSIWLTFAMRLPQPLPLLVSFFAMTPVIGKITVAAKNGADAAGFLSPTPSGELGAFVARYSVLTLAWLLPLNLVGTALIKQAVLQSLADFKSVEGALLRLLVVVLVVVFALAPSLSLLVAARTQTVAECFTSGPWRWIQMHREEVLVFHVVLIGGALLFMLIALPVFVLAGALLHPMSSKLGIALCVAGYVLPLSASPVLMARLAGVLARDEVSSASAPLVSEPGAFASAGETASPAPVAPAPKPIDIAAELAKVTSRAVTDLASAIADAEALRSKTSDAPTVLAELVRLHLKAGSSQQSLEVGARAIPAALSRGEQPIATNVYVALREHRKALKLTADDWDKLARALLAAAQYSDAAWCFVASGNAGGDKTRWQKGMVSVGDAATRTGALETASAVYQHVIKAAPGTPTADYCKQCLERMKPRLRPKDQA